MVWCECEDVKTKEELCLVSSHLRVAIATSSLSSRQQPSDATLSTKSSASFENSCVCAATHRLLSFFRPVNTFLARPFRRPILDEQESRRVVLKWCSKLRKSP